MSKKYTEITGDELKEMLKFLNKNIKEFSTFNINKLPEKESWNTESWGKLGENSMSIKLVIERNIFADKDE